MGTRITISELVEAKRQHRKIAAVSCYDYTTATLIAQAGIDVWTTEDRVAILNVDNPRTIGDDFVFQRPDRGEYWMTTGVMAMLIACQEWHPLNIHWVGFD